MHVGPFTNELRDRVVEHFMFTFPCRSLEHLNPWGGCYSEDFTYDGRPESLYVKHVGRTIVDTHMRWAEFKRRATKLAASSLFQ
ncbi:MAG: hypothetical protein C0483_18510 [Pirellula sp.]|nr:hypothetical protein [Pirellula sp.]